MEILTELVKIIKNNIDKDFVKVSGTPKRCVLNQCYDLINLSGYVAEIYDRDNEKDLLFIADEPDGRNFHNGCLVLGNGHRIPDIIWFKEVHDKITILEGFYI